MRLTFFLQLSVILVLRVSTRFVDVSKIAVDCDVEFADTATQMASAYINNPDIVQYVHAVMSSCNKAPIQKITESSVFLLQKGTITPKVMSEIKQLYDELQKKKEAEMEKRMSKLPPELYSTAQRLRMVSTSAGLSGNERKIQIEDILKTLPENYQQQVIETMVQKPAKVDGSLIQMPEAPIEITTTKVEEAPSFAIPKEQIEEEDEKVLEDTQTHKAIVQQIQIHPQQITKPQQNVLFPDLPPTQPIKPSNAEESPYGKLSALFSSPRVDILLKNLVQQGVKASEQRAALLPQSVGSVNHNAKQKNDLDLLNPAVWSDAASILSKSSNDLPSALNQLLDQSQLSKIVKQSAARINDNDLLMSRRLNDGALESYDTNIDRFASSGPSKKYEIPMEVMNQLTSVLSNAGKTLQSTETASSQIGLAPVNGLKTYAPAPTAIVPNVVQPVSARSAEEITGTFRQSMKPVYNERLPNGQLRNVKIDLVNEQ